MQRTHLFRTRNCAELEILNSYRLCDVAVNPSLKNPRRRQCGLSDCLKRSKLVGGCHASA